MLSGCVKTGHIVSPWRVGRKASKDIPIWGEERVREAGSEGVLFLFASFFWNPSTLHYLWVREQLRKRGDPSFWPEWAKGGRGES
jgi:hypothetical protein